MIHKFNIPNKIYKQLLKFSKESKIPYNKDLAGNIKKEYSLNNYKKYVENFIIEEFCKFDALVNDLKEINVLYPNPLKITLSSLWVNYQKKHEFNPLHNHGGLYSFIFFMKIPYTMEEENLLSPGLNSNDNKSGRLCFYILDQNIKGNIKCIPYDVDKTWEKTGLIFKSDLNHCVYPFFSNGIRITISGNLGFSTI